MFELLSQILSDPILDDHHKVAAARAALGQLEKYADRPVTRTTVLDDLDALIVDAMTLADGGRLAVTLCAAREAYASGDRERENAAMDRAVMQHQAANVRRN